MGKRSITPETAKGLAAAIGTSPEYWMNLEASYQLWRSQTDSADAVARRAKIYTLAPIADMIRRGWIEPSENVDVLEAHIMAFFEVQSLDQIPEFHHHHAARKSSLLASPYDDTTPAQRLGYSGRGN